MKALVIGVLGVIVVIVVGLVGLFGLGIVVVSANFTALFMNREDRGK